MYHTEKYNFYAKGIANSLPIVIILFFSFATNAQQYYEDSDSYYVAPKYGYGNNIEYNIISPSDDDISNQLNNLNEQLSAKIENEIQYQDNDDVYQEYRGNYSPPTNIPEHDILSGNVEYEDNDSFYKEYRGGAGTYSDESGYVGDTTKKYDTYYNDTNDGKFDDSGYGANQDNDANYDGFHNWKGDGADNDGDWYPMHFYY